MKLSLFSFGKADALALRLAQSITTRYPPVIANTPERVVSLERIEEILDAIFSGTFEDRNRPGLLARATLGYAFKWRLREIGYDGDFVDFAARKLGDRLAHRND